MSVKHSNASKIELEIENEKTAVQNCPECGSEMLKRVKSRANKYTHKKCLNCEFGYIIGR